MEHQSSGLMVSILEAQTTYERRFNCVVCMDAKLEMVYGYCQHRLCADCLYLENGSLRPNMTRCPVCSMYGAFPSSRPDIPEDNLEIQRCLGIRDCPNKEHGCTFQMWDWEIDDHKRTCQYEQFDFELFTQTKDLTNTRQHLRESSRQSKKKGKAKPSASKKMSSATASYRRSVRQLRSQRI